MCQLLRANDTGYENPPAVSLGLGVASPANKNAPRREYL